MKWVTRERPVIDRIACPWLIARFIDKQPEFLFVPPDQVSQVAAETGAIPYDVPGVELTHVGEGCSFDSFVSKYDLDSDPAIVTVASIVRGADTNRHDLTPQSAGLLAISMGLRDLSPDDHEVLNHGFIIYDALYAWASHRTGLKGDTTRLLGPVLSQGGKFAFVLLATAAIESIASLITFRYHRLSGLHKESPAAPAGLS